MIEFSLASLYPCPFNSILQITIGCPQESEVGVDIYNLLGRKVTSIHRDFLPAGYHHLSWQANEPSGVYLLRVISSSGWIDARIVVT